ncbi:carbamoyltransferase HypF [Thiobacillus sedimenti]|uniref:Carbamoyltransferase HypF n=1 Tax=Thiobacillus sedimenti TaxID=3110231 RepID=A0ABZ1CMZ2_9PROT|nr:carbamoyltransferase HypF [Thiobacillus sp. SCUT-2]WRS40564.1 carbamoyltransferase HypF [Thiobacillus sp. SCUT-2]
MPEREARHLTLSGKVQGVGFRPFVHRLAHRHGITGWVRNASGAVEIHAEGEPAQLERFVAALVAEAPPLSAPGPLGMSRCPPEGHAAFAILDSAAGREADIHLPADGFVCADCLAELEDPANRRHRYPFINCTQCGPRYTLITALPYDRPNTAMRDFALCPDCRAEYENPLDRRFHAEPMACPVCGPHLHFVEGERIEPGDEAALAAAVAALRAGKIVAAKGVGGYHLMCDATNDAAIAALRERKPRPAKPLAVMFPGLDALRAAVHATPALEAFLASPERPIVLLPKRAGANLSRHIAPGLAEIGCLLPYSPLHALLLADFGGALVATSGNLSGEPVLTENADAQARLAHLADAFLHHDRPIVRPADDPVYRPIAGAPRPLRLGRGSAPLELDLPVPLSEPLLALGSHMKNTVCLAWENRAVVSPHIGELDTARSLDTLAQVAADLQRLYQVEAKRLIVDRHPGYGYRRYARDSGLPLAEVWHHHAHASALAWEFPETEDWIVFAWDGVGLGADRTLWGGEAFTGAPGRWRHAASFRPFRLPGGDKAGREPWRAAAALRWETGADAPFAPAPLHQAWAARLNSPVSTAVGRLFDAAAALAGVCTHASFEGEGPMQLDALAQACALRPEPPDKARDRPVDGRAGSPRAIPLPLEPDAAGLWRSDWAPLLPMLADPAVPVAERAAVFHASLAQALVDQAVRLREATGASSVGLTGGVFQNRVLAEAAIAGLRAAGFTACLPQRIPVNDAGLSFGQVIEFLHR